MNVLSEMLSSKIRVEIFRLLFGVSEEALHMREIARRSGCAIGTIQAELKKLSRLDLVKKKNDGNRVYYRANKEHPLYPDIRNLVLKTVGLVDIIRDALDGDPDIKLAFVYGSIARNAEKAASDVDLMIVGNLGLREVSGLLAGLSDRIGREINPHVLSIEEFTRRKIEGEHFIRHVINAPKIFIMGSEDELTAMAG